ncbi:translation initiation protein Sua5 [Trematosphaeria pertusa]|uniref:Threonylcarbamoyl-AMP synthase n=1 Tax=Trematosphaeria pertusa TaxID=390896 RepID=A0A6A6HTK2_9PLEO|nr:translation initiation protein Sua5 [Trematosphaeria pertusa]KAF2240863.1 translation initiation protein Sua5 [Trematosphaeria pertusa]
MPIHYLRIPNVQFTRSFSSYTRALQALAQAAAPESRHIPLSALNASRPRFYPHNVDTFTMETATFPVDPTKLGEITIKKAEEVEDLVDRWSIQYEQGQDSKSLHGAARELRETDIPVAFPTETVYGLGADATRSSAVRAIFAAKGRPADNPLIVHVHSIPQLRSLLWGKKHEVEGGPDPIPEIYKPLIRKFWPGPLTIILPNPEGSVLAPEVTAGLNTFGARMPRSILALALIRLAGVPLAAPSANASTRPSPTAAEHVKEDLDGRIHTIIDGGPCEVGVESTVVDGLSYPPTILRPGGVTVEQLRRCSGWENVVVGYKDNHEQGIKPRAPGMKYRHYSPKATVILYEAGTKPPELLDMLDPEKGYSSIGIIRTKSWSIACGSSTGDGSGNSAAPQINGTPKCTTTIAKANFQNPDSSPSNLLRSVFQHQVPHATLHSFPSSLGAPTSVWDIALGTSTEDVARGLFSALRELDKKRVDVIFVEGLDDKVGDDIAAAVMNRLRKAAEIRI